ncbi:MAG: hypothetical protein ED557_09825 [Balneola sp.]|nr:MAG: hypothetical protein ED557_09825 [Balneola sp.]
MIKKIISILTFSLYSIFVYAQHDSLKQAAPYAFILDYFEKENFSGLHFQEIDSVNFDTLAKTRDFHLSISDHPIELSTKQKVLSNPFYSDDFGYFKNRDINYPISYSTIYENKLISLFRNGRFLVHSLTNFERDKSFEKQLNTKKFSYHWFIDGKLYARTKNRFFGRLLVWENNRWTKAKIRIPVKNQPTFYDTKDYIIFGDCFGEWGGSIYFYERETHDIFFTESTCTTSVFWKENSYFVLSNLGHLFGRAVYSSINDPSKLSNRKDFDVNKEESHIAIGHKDTTSERQEVFEFFDLQLFSTFYLKDRQLYIAHIKELTFLIEILGSEFQIVHPLFNSDLYTHDPITRKYGENILINLTHYGTAYDRETSVIIINENGITKLDWNEAH